MVRYVPEGYHAVTPYLIIKDAARALDFYRKVFGAVEVMRFNDPSGKIGHAEIRIGDAHVMLADEHETMGYKSPAAYGGTPVSLVIYVEDVDAVFQRALDAGAESRQAVKDQFYGDRNGTVKDPFGHVWTLSTHKEEVSMEEMMRRAKEQRG